MLWDARFFLDHVGGYDPDIRSAEDWDIALRTARALTMVHARSAPLSRPTVLYRVHKNNLGPQNIKDGTRWSCYKRIFAKHLKGGDYQLALARSGFRILRALLPEPIKKPLRILRDSVLTTPPLRLLPYADEFVRELERETAQEFRIA